MHSYKGFVVLQQSPKKKKKSIFIHNGRPHSFSPFYLFLYTMTISKRQHTLDRLDYYYRVINKTIIAKQNASSGLMPASTAITVRKATVSASL